MQRMAEINNVETFIQCADEILEKVIRNPMRLAEAQEEARNLLRHFEGFLESKGLEC